MQSIAIKKELLFRALSNHFCYGPRHFFAIEFMIISLALFYFLLFLLHFVLILCFFPLIKDKRIDCATALDHSYLIDGRARYHACMCRCCPNINDNNSVGGNRKFCSDPEPISPIPFNNSFEKELTSVQIVKGNIREFSPILISSLDISFV